MSSLHILKYSFTISNILTTFHRFRFQIKLLLCWIFPMLRKGGEKYCPLWLHKGHRTVLAHSLSKVKQSRRSKGWRHTGHSELFSAQYQTFNFENLFSTFENLLFWMQSSRLTSSTCACVCCSRLLLVRFGAAAAGPPSPSGPPPASGVDLHDRRRNNVIYYVSLSLSLFYFYFIAWKREIHFWWVCMYVRRSLNQSQGRWDCLKAEWLMMIDRLLFSGVWLQLNFEFTKYWCSRFL